MWVISDSRSQSDPVHEAERRELQRQIQQAITNCSCLSDGCDLAPRAGMSYEENFRMTDLPMHSQEPLGRGDAG